MTRLNSQRLAALGQKDMLKIAKILAPEDLPTLPPTHGENKVGRRQRTWTTPRPLTPRRGRVRAGVRAHRLLWITMPWTHSVGLPV